MIISIDRIKIKERVRKDFGDIDGLAADIEKNGLINPITISDDYVLLAGERRLIACQRLGWKEIPTHMLPVQDAEQELQIEISENEKRKNFSKEERLDYALRLERIEAEKARERQGTRADLSNEYQNIVQNFAQGSDKKKTRDAVAAKLGIGSGWQYEKEKAISGNKDLLSEDEFKDWDKGKTSTNAAYNKIIERRKDPWKEFVNEKAERIKEIDGELEHSEFPELSLVKERREAQSIIMKDRIQKNRAKLHKATMAMLEVTSLPEEDLLAIFGDLEIIGEEDSGWLDEFNRSTIQEDLNTWTRCPQIIVAAIRKVMERNEGRKHSSGKSDPGNNSENAVNVVRLHP